MKLIGHLLLVVTVVGLIHIQYTNGAELDIPIGDVRNCFSMSPLNSSQPFYRMEVLPGIGFDNLRSIDMGQVHHYNYSLCKVSDDGSYLLPDNINLIPIKASTVETFAEYFDHWDQYTSMTSYSIGAHASAHFLFVKVSAKFSYDYINTKSYMYNDNSVSTRVQVKHKLYTVKIEPDTPLHLNFKSRIFDIAANLQANNTRIARFLADILVRDYGTHYLTSMDAGAIIAQIDFIDSSYVARSSSNKQAIKASASASFFGKVTLDANFANENSHSDQSGFTSYRTYSKVVALGGPPFKVNSTLEEWEAGVPNDLVAVDRSGNQLHFVVNPNTVPELDEATIQTVSDFVYEATNRYFQVNTILGCTNRNATNFNFQANVDDGSCTMARSNASQIVDHNFGGVFQNCTGSGNNISLSPDCIPNINQCPVGYNPIEIHSFTSGYVQYNAYWCAPLPDTSNFPTLYFGGFYTSTNANPITGVVGCPNYFYPQRWTLSPGEDVFICVSSDAHYSPRYAVPFGGFESCETGNPFIFMSNSNIKSPENYPHSCPLGYTKYPVIFDDGCWINVCLILNSTSGIQALLPPFHKYPNSVNTNEVLATTFTGAHGEKWIKDPSGQWVISGGNGSNGTTVNKTSPSKISSDPSNLVIAVASAFGTLVLGAVIVVLAFLGLYAVKGNKRRVQQYGNYTQINDSVDKQCHPSDVTTEAA